MGKHTREPWIIAAFDGNDEYGAPILCRPYGETIGKFKLGHDRSRAVVCVNACATIANPEALGEVLAWCERMEPALRNMGYTASADQLRAALAAVQREGGE